MIEPLRDKLIRCGWVTNFNADTLVQLIERHYAALAQPEPPGPTDEELLELSAHHGVSYTMSSGEVVYPMQQGYDMRDDVLSFARAVLARWGRPAIEPVPNSMAD
jgi:hypothetical protein